MAEGLPADVTDRASLERAFDAVGRCDVLINSAGTMSQAPFEQVTDAEFDRLLAVNVRGLFACCQLATRDMPVRRTDRECVLARGARRKGHLALRGDQSRGERTHPLACDRAFAARHHRECGGAGLHRHAVVARRR